ncbi:MAG TPA: biopolymer transporter ExbD [Deltaproteobacteria bacterium]|nr:biopolymer transporter ExbD [Deltaproteobacteria bacterium]HQI80645.1 biopolymer transporter ExbD [Deltaproteobacteria bacterium]
MLGDRKPRKRQAEVTDLDLVPIMNMFLVIIPFLLISASFFHLRAINTTVPVLSSKAESGPVQSTAKVTVIVQLEETGITVSAMSDEVDEQTLRGFETVIAKEGTGRYAMDRLSSFLQGIKTSYPLSDTVIIMPGDTIVYETIIRAMDVARNTGETQLFPNVVISGKVG